MSDTIEDARKFTTALLDNRILRSIGATADNKAVKDNRIIIKEYMGWDLTKTIEDYEELEDV